MKRDPVIWLQGNTMATLGISNVYHWPSFEGLRGQTELTLGNDGEGSSLRLQYNSTAVL